MFPPPSYPFHRMSVFHPIQQPGEPVCHFAGLSVTVLWYSSHRFYLRHWNIDLFRLSLHPARRDGKRPVTWATGKGGPRDVKKGAKKARFHHLNWFWNLDRRRQSWRKGSGAQPLSGETIILSGEWNKKGKKNESETRKSLTLVKVIHDPAGGNKEW